MKKKLKITVERLREIVAEELEAFPGWNELATLANGVAEREELDEMNPYHDADDGRFTSKEDSDCDSLYFHNGTRKGKGPKHISGQGRTKGGQGEFKCSTGEKKPVKEGRAEQNASYVRALVRAELEAAIAQLQARSANSKTECTPQDLLKFMNRYSKASEGSLGKKG